MLALTFSVGPMHFAIPSRRVSQIVPLVPLRQVAGVGAEIAGLLEIGTDVVPVVDLGMRLRGEPCAQRLSTRIVVVLISHAEHRVELGLIAENVTDLCPMDEGADVAAAGSALEGELGGVARLRGELMQWIEIDRILTEAQRERVYQGILARRK